MFIIALLAFAVFAHYLWRARIVGPVLYPSTYFLIFFSLTWSPAAFLSVARTHVADYQIAEGTQIKFLCVYCLICICVCIGYRCAVAFLSDVRHPAKLPICGNPGRIVTVLTIVAVAVLAVYLSSSGYRRYLVDILNYVRSAELISYNELRRNTLYEGVVLGALHSRFQFSLFLLVFVGLLMVGLYFRRWLPTCASVAVGVFLFGSASLKKMPYLFFFATAAACWIDIYRFKGGRFRGLLSALIPIAGALVFVIIGLYVIQYRDAQKVGIDRIWEILVYRIFSAYPDGCKLYVDMFPDPFPYTYGRTSLLLAPIIGYYGAQPYTLVPEFFGLATTFPSGFAAYAYADFGVGGVVVYSLVVGSYLRLLDWCAATRRYAETASVARVALGMSTLWLCTKAFSTSLLTGGLGLIPLLLVALEKYLASGDRRFGVGGVRTSMGRHPNRGGPHSLVGMRKQLEDRQ